jgi:hypothetical protein
MVKYIRNGDFVGGVVSFIAGGFMLGNAVVFGRQISGSIGADFFPKLISAALMLVAAGLIAEGVRQVNVAEAGSGERPKKRNNYPGFALAVGALMLYILLMRVLGFIIATIPFTLALIMILIPKEKKNWPLFLGIAAGVTLGAYFLFTKVFFVMLPKGLLG